MMFIEAKFEIGQTVYLSTDPDQFPRIVTRLVVMPNNLITYFLNTGPLESSHYDFEITETKDVLSDR